MIASDLPATIPDLLRVVPGTPVDLADRNASATPGYDGDKESSLAVAAALQQRLAELQDVLYADGRHRLLVVLQATDTGGKDGTIRNVFGAVDPIGVHARSFKKPTEPELARDFLWRVHAQVPAAGELVVFNRSHYEDVLVTRVHGLVDDERARRRFEHIRAFEALLADEGTTIVKVFLQISKAEQRERLQARLDDPAKHWKFSLGDLAEREHWDRYVEVHGEAIFATATEHAPWFVVPADRKWYRNLAVASIVVSTLESLDLRYPPAEDDLAGVVVT